MLEVVRKWAAQRGFRIAWGSVEVAEDARREIAGLGAGSAIEARFFEDELSSVIAGAEERLGPTIVIVATPRPAHRVHFEFEDRIVDALLPPTYFRYRALFEKIRMDLAKNGLPGARVEQLTGPLKAIAARLGLIAYGRNNIGYVPGIGSYFQLCGYWTDAELPESKRMVGATGSLLPQCEGCSICISICPTGAIEEGRVLLRAERCLTFANENPGDWPAWVSVQAHNSLLGCLECQRNCPANPELPIEDTGLVFSAAETRLLLSDELNVLEGRTETGIRAKLAWLGQPYAEPVLGRNLCALAKSQQ
jgi:epoxyqueuosine reductase